MTMKTKRRLKSLLKYLVLACFLVLTMFSLCVDASHILKRVPGGNLCVSGTVSAQSRVRGQLCGHAVEGEFRPVYA